MAQCKSPVKTASSWSKCECVLLSPPPPPKKNEEIRRRKEKNELDRERVSERARKRDERVFFCLAFFYYSPPSKPSVFFSPTLLLLPSLLSFSTARALPHPLSLKQSLHARLPFIRKRQRSASFPPNFCFFQFFRSFFPFGFSQKKK